MQLLFRIIELKIKISQVSLSIAYKIIGLNTLLTANFFAIFNLTLLILYTIGTVFIISSYRIISTRGYLLLSLLYIFVLPVILANTLLFAYGISLFSNTLFLIFNRGLLIFAYLLGFELLKNTENDISDRTRKAFHIYTLLVMVVSVYLFINDKWETEVHNPLYWFSYHSFGILTTAILTYAFWVTPTYNETAKRIKLLLKIGWVVWPIQYTVQFIFEGLLDTQWAAEFALYVLLAAYSITAIVTNYVVVFYPENLLISKSQILQACKLYLKVNVYDKTSKQLGFNNIKNYVKQIPIVCNLITNLAMHDMSNHPTGRQASS